MSNFNNSRYGSVSVYRMKNTDKQAEMDSLTRDYAANKSNHLLHATIMSLKAWDTCPTGEWKTKWLHIYEANKARAYAAPKPVILPVENTAPAHNMACKTLRYLGLMQEGIARAVEHNYWLPVRYCMGVLAKKYALFMAQNMAYSRESIQERLDIELGILKTMQDDKIGAYVADSMLRYKQAFSPTADKCQCHKVDDDAEMVKAFAEVGLRIQDNNTERVIVPLKDRKIEGCY